MTIHHSKGILSMLDILGILGILGIFLELIVK